VQKKKRKRKERKKSLFLGEEERERVSSASRRTMFGVNSGRPRASVQGVITARSAQTGAPCPEIPISGKPMFVRQAQLEFIFFPRALARSSICKTFSDTKLLRDSERASTIKGGIFPMKCHRHCLLSMGRLSK
jgi:hypothetical protein